VWGKDSPIGQHISNVQTIWQLSAGNEKSVPALKINIYVDIADSIPYLVPTQFQELIFSPITRPKISEPELVNVQGAQESITRNRFRQPM
jgi:hypothetical protein